MRTIIPTALNCILLPGARKFLLLLVLSFFFTTTISSRLHAYPAIFEIILNSEAKGSFFIEVSEDEDFLVRQDDFKTLGLVVPDSEAISIDGENYFSLANQPDLSFKLDEQTLSLIITVNPDVLPLNRIDFTNRRPENLYQPHENSFFLNYGLSATGNKNDSMQLFDFTHELAYRNEKTLFLSDGIYSRTEDDSGYIRLLSRVIREDRISLRRVTGGDHYVLSGPLGSQVLVGGAGYSRNFNIDPYDINYPSVHLGGAATTPSTAEIYIDGMLMRKEELPPGPFMLENLTRYEGAGDIEIVLRDAFNQEQRISHPFYLAENLLVPGAHEFSYNTGALREAFGIESNDYGDIIFSGFHRYGFRDWLTFGLSSEISPDFFSLSPRASMKWQHYGYFDISIGASSGSGDHNGFATAVEYLFLNRRFSTGLKIRNFSENYSRLDDQLRPDKPQLELQFRIGYSTASFGSLNLGFSSTTFHIGEDRDEISLTYNRRLGRNLSMYATVNQLSEVEDETTLLVGFNFSPWRHNQISARIEERERSRTASIGVQKDPPLGAGHGYRADIELNETDVSDSYSLNLAGQYNNRINILRGETDLASVDGEFLPTYRVAASGAVANIGGMTRLSRPIRDSFTLVKVGNLQDVRVVRNSSVIGTTDKSGIVMVPELTSYYDNQVAVRDEDIPIEYGLETSLQYVQPPLRSGSCIIFSATKIQPIVGKFFIIQGGKKVPYDFRSLKIILNGTSLETQTGYDGEFYIDVSEAGEGHAVLLGCDKMQQAETDIKEALLIEYNYEGSAGKFELAIPQSEELFIDMGEIVLNNMNTLGSMEKE